MHRASPSRTGAGVPEAATSKSFDVICAGDARWRLPTIAATSESIRLRPGAGSTGVAVALAREGLRVGLATVLADDEAGRSSCAKLAARGVDVDGVLLARPRSGVMIVDASGVASRAPSRTLGPLPADEEEPPFDVPAGWRSEILLLSGLSPVVSHAAAMCKAARRARRSGGLVLIDFNASLHVWAGRDARTTLMTLREIDVARCSLADLAVLGMSRAEVRTALRKNAVLVVSEEDGATTATGPFGEVSVVPRPETRARLGLHGLGDAFTAAVCAALVRRGVPGESPSGMWHRALLRGHAAVATAAG